MPQEPKRRHSRQRKGKRRASIKLSSPKISYCQNCGSITTSHTVCKNCGYYKGREVIKKGETLTKDIEPLENQAIK